MATRAYEAAPLDLILSALPTLPRPILSRLVARAIERLDEIDGDPDLEGAHDEDVPDFRKRRRLRNSQRRRAIPGGPRCKISDCDFGGEEAGEPDQGGHVVLYGIDQRHAVTPWGKHRID